MNTDSNGNPATSPAISRTVVPEFPASKCWDGAVSPRRPRPSIVTVVPLRVIETPNRRRHSSVLTQSALSAKFSMVVVPSATAAIIAKRWLMDLSPGTDAIPLILAAGAISRRSVSIIRLRLAWSLTLTNPRVT